MHPDFYLTPEESALVENASWLLTKHRIIGKVYGVFGALSEMYATLMDDYAEFIPKEVNAISPKIYKGEQYRQLPYVMLDQPRFFKHEDVFAIRSFFWWGNSFSIHLLLGGKYKLMYQDKINAYLKAGGLSSWYIGVSADPWQHHFEQDNYLPIKDLAGKDITQEGNYLKIGKWHGVNDWKGAYAFFISSYKHLLETLV